VGIITFQILFFPVTMAWHFLRLRMEEPPPIWRVGVNRLNKQLWRGGPPPWGLGEGFLTLKMYVCYEIFTDKASGLE
jgi:hypothetical protein